MSVQGSADHPEESGEVRIWLDEENPPGKSILDALELLRREQQTELIQREQIGEGTLPSLEEESLSIDIQEELLRSQGVDVDKMRDAQARLDNLRLQRMMQLRDQLTSPKAPQGVGSAALNDRPSGDLDVEMYRDGYSYIVEHPELLDSLLETLKENSRFKLFAVDFRNDFNVVGQTWRDNNDGTRSLEFTGGPTSNSFKTHRYTFGATLHFTIRPENIVPSPSRTWRTAPRLLQYGALFSYSGEKPIVGGDRYSRCWRHTEFQLWQPVFGPDGPGVRNVGAPQRETDLLLDQTNTYWDATYHMPAFHLFPQAVFGERDFSKATPLNASLTMHFETAVKGTGAVLYTHPTVTIRTQNWHLFPAP
ncbi:hypothetical protein [Streptomyces sp. NPDC048606]|uniref:hypothetical protein n=1 Tax=Streptomyces sp. NPDC048606 TaxID=3154726 RepID=UPI00342DFC73